MTRQTVAKEDKTHYAKRKRVQTFFSIMRIATFYLLLIALLVTSCAGGNGTASDTSNTTIAFDSIVLEERIKLFPDKTDSLPCATLSIKFVYPTAFGSKEKLRELQSLFYEIILGKKYTDALTPHEAVRIYSSVFASTYRRETTENYREEIETVDFTNEENEYLLHAMGHTRDFESKVVYADENILIISTFTWEYLGGAHGNTWRKNHTIDLQSIDTVSLSQLFSEENQVALSTIVKEKLLQVMREKLKEAEIEAEDEDEIKTYFEYFNGISANENFMLTATSINFTYNPYEIAPYVVGGFDIEIPYTEITHLLNPETFTTLFPQSSLPK